MCVSECVGKIFGGVAFAAALGIGLATVFADSVQKTTGMRARKQVELDLSYARMQERFVREGVEPEDARDAMARWHDENKVELEELREQEREAYLMEKKRLGNPSFPENVPSLRAVEIRAFVAAAETYLGQGWAACSSKVETGGNPERARDNYSQWLEKNSQKRLVSLLKQTRQQIWREDNEAMIPDPVLSDEELSKLDPEEKIHEEIYTRMLALYAEPLADGEEDRDRMGQIQEFHMAKLKELSAIGMQRRPARAAARVKELEGELANTPN